MAPPATTTDSGSRLAPSLAAGAGPLSATSRSLTAAATGKMKQDQHEYSASTSSISGGIPDHNLEPSMSQSSSLSLSQSSQLSLSQSSQSILFSQSSQLSLSQTSQSSIDLTSPSKLTDEQRARMEANRKKALERKKLKQQQRQQLKRRMEENRKRALATKREKQQERQNNKKGRLTEQASQEAGPLPDTLRNSQSQRTANPAAGYQEGSFGMPDTVSSSSHSGSDMPLNLPPIPSTVDGMTLSDEQRAIVELARPPTQANFANGAENNNATNGNRHLVRVTAAAGTGKTTTLIQLALRCIQVGHSHLTYVTFTKASATDAKRRICTALAKARERPEWKERQEEGAAQPIVDACTLHACAMRLNGTDEEAGKILGDEDFKKLIGEICHDDIEDYLVEAYRYIESNKGQQNEAQSDGSAPTGASVQSRKRRAKQQVVYFIYKTLINFCHNKLSLENFEKKNNSYRHYYPVHVKGFHSKGKDGEEKYGFPSSHYSKLSVYQYYADAAVKVWKFACREGTRNYDFEMKKAQLNKVRILGTVLLVDECQDMDGCQVAWVHDQLVHGTHIYFVGDAAQTIYTFRGAKSKHVTELDAVDRSLTMSFRFGPNIARIANTVLFAKHYSKQTTSENKTWIPYRLKGLERNECVVTAESIRPLWKEKPVTLIAWSNGILMFAAMEIMGMGSLLEPDDDDMDAESNEGEPVVKIQHAPSRLPKISINGKGEGSGLKKWKQAVELIDHLLDLYMAGEQGMVLPENPFHEFANQRMTWHDFIKGVEALELSRYVQSIQIINAYGDKTKIAMGFFEREVMEKKYGDDEADIILSTCHSAKGMEWDNVEVLDDFVGLASYCDDDFTKVTGDCSLFSCDSLQQSPVTPRKAAKKCKARKRWQFAQKDYGDDLNLLYVACTRAKKMLCIPKKLQLLFSEFDILGGYVDSWQKAFDKTGEDASVDNNSVAYILSDKRKLTKKDVCALYKDLCIPLRGEAGLGECEQFMGTVVACVEEDDAEFEAEVKEEVRVKEEENTL